MKLVQANDRGLYGFRFVMLIVKRIYKGMIRVRGCVSEVIWFEEWCTCKG